MKKFVNIIQPLQTIIIFLIVTVVNMEAATITWDGGAGDGQWTTAANWDGNVLPGSSDDVVINNGNLVTLSAASVTVNSIAISSNSDLTVSSGAILNVNHTGFERGIDVNGFGSEVKNAGTINIAGGSYGLYLKNARWTNQSGGVTDISSFYSYGYYSEGGTLTNNGMMTVDGATNNGSLGIRFLSSGTISNNAGSTMIVQNVSSHGVNVPSSGTFGNSGNFIISNCGGTALSGTWIDNYSSGTLTISDVNVGISGIVDFNNQGTINISNATNVGITMEDVNFSNSGTIMITDTGGYAFDFDDSGFYSYTFSNTGTLKGTGTFDMAGNSLGGTVAPGNSPGTMTFPVSQTFLASSTTTIDLNGTTPGTGHDQIIVNGTATIGGTLNVSEGYTPAKGDRLTILTATAVSGTFSTVNLPYDWEIEYSATKVELVFEYTRGKWDGEVGDGQWTNADNWEGGILPTSTDDVVINNGNLVTLSAASVTVNSIAISSNSDLTVSSGAILNVNHTGFERGIDVNGFGSEVKNAGTINIAGGSYGLYLKNARWTNQSGGVTDISSFYSYGYYSEGGTLTNNGMMTVDGATNNGSLGIRFLSSGTISNNAGSTMIVQNVSSHGVNVPSSGTFGNSGNFIISNCGGTALSGTWIDNYSSGTLTISDVNVGISGIVDFNNQGTINISNATNVGITMEDVNFSNSGTIMITGTGGYAFDFDDSGFYSYTFSNTGTLKGTGTFDMAGNSLGGTVAPGNSPGTMTFPVNQTLSSSSTLAIEVNGTTANTEHDQIVVNGTVTISGTLNASIDYSPTNGDRILIISATAISGTFSSISPALLDDWSVDYSVAGEVALVYSGVSLPVELINFQAQREEESVVINWETASEIYNSHFEVNWSMDGVNFEMIGEAIGAGNSIENNFYEFLHEKPMSGPNYYQLKQVDFDGRSEYSEIIQVNMEQLPNPSIKVFPNPSANFIQIEGLEVFEEVQVFDINGQVVQVFNIQNSGDSISIQHLPNGTYFLRIGQVVKKLIVEK